MSLKFEWNRSKAKDNYAKHGVSFEFAKEVFKDPFAVEFLDDREDYGEERFVVSRYRYDLRRDFLCSV
jgi:uncharacterized protein